MLLGYQSLHIKPILAVPCDFSTKPELPSINRALPKHNDRLIDTFETSYY